MSVALRLPKYNYEISVSRERIIRDYPKSMLGEALVMDPDATDLNIEEKSITRDVLEYIGIVINDQTLPVLDDKIRDDLGRAGRYFLMDVLRVAADPLYHSLVKGTKVNLLDLTSESYETCMTWAICNKFLQLIDYIFRNTRRAPYKDIDPRMFIISIIKGLPKVASAFIKVRKVDPATATWTEEDHTRHFPYNSTQNGYGYMIWYPEHGSPSIYYSIRCNLPVEFIKTLVVWPGAKIGSDIIHGLRYLGLEEIIRMSILAGGDVPLRTATEQSRDP